MNKELIALQENCKSNGVIILDEHYKELGPTLFMEGNKSDVNLFACSYKNPVFKEQLEEMSKKHEQVYFVIRHMEQLTKEEQNRYISLVKDREFCGYFLPDNVLLVFTIEKQSDLQKISEELYQFSVVAIKESYEPR